LKRLALCAALALAVATPALAASTSIKVNPTTVKAGQRVVVSGNAGDCPAGDAVTLLSKAFSHRHDFAGLPAVYAKVKTGGHFGHSVKVPSGTRPGRYTISGRCGGGNLGVQAHLRVTSA
jgi:opacity protein-like surface antigen